jgi:hypothetical protein
MGAIKMKEHIKKIADSVEELRCFILINPESNLAPHISRVVSYANQKIRKEGDAVMGKTKTGKMLYYLRLRRYCENQLKKLEAK